MILGDDDQVSRDGATLDGLFRRAGVRNSDRLALVDPPDRARVTDGAPQRLTFSEADRAISALAARLRTLGLPTDTVVALQLANTVESVIALLAVLRAGLIAAPLPLLWRSQEMIAALGQIGAKAIITTSRIGSARPAEVAVEVAAALFPIRHVCAFGNDLPDGVVALDEVVRGGDFIHMPARLGQAAAHIAAITFDVTPNGLVAVARNHTELIAGGMAPFLEAGMTPDSVVLSAVPPASFAGLALTVVPWLLAGGTLHLHHPFAAEAFAAQCSALDGGIVVLPAAAIAPLAQAGRNNIKIIIALWRAPERLEGEPAWPGEAALVDVAAFGEIGLIAGRREADGLPAPLPYGSIAAPRGATSALALIETGRTVGRSLGLRGAMVPNRAFPPGVELGHAPHLAPDPAGYIDTGFACRYDRRDKTLSLTAPPAGLSFVGGYRLRERALEDLVAGINPEATIMAAPDAALGQRFAGSAHDREAMIAALQAGGANPLVFGAFRVRGREAV